MTRKNARTLDVIAGEIHNLERSNLFGKGDLLIEAKDQCEHGEWLAWLDDEFEWSPDTAEKYMKVAGLSTKFRKLRNLKLGKTTLYQLADHEPEDALPAIIEELAKHATKKHLPPRNAERVIDVGIGRHRYGDHPDATLAALVDLTRYGYRNAAWRERAVAELLRLEPNNDEAAAAIISDVSHQDDGDEGEDDAASGDGDRERGEGDDDDIEATLEGAPPNVPPPVTSDDQQKLGTETVWPEAKEFDSAVTNLFALRGKPVARFVGRFDSAQLREVADFLMAVVSGSKPTAA